MPETTEVPETLELPPPPAELWMLWNASGFEGLGCWVVSVDDAPGGETYLAALGQVEAQAAAAHQWEMYQIECIPVRVK